MSEVQQPVAAEPVAPVEPVIAAPPATTETTPAAEPTIPAATSAEPGSEAKVVEPVKSVEESKETAPVKEEAKPVYEGALQYHGGAGGSIKSLIGLKDKFFFYFGEDSVAAEKLNHLVKPSKDALKETVAWSSQTGKGLLYYVKHPDQKTSPKGVIGLADVEDAKAVGHNEISFKAHGQKHSLIAETKIIRDGWLLALHEKIEEAKALKDEVHAKDGFRETMDKLTHKPAVPVVAAAKTSEPTPKKSSDSKAERSARSEVADSKKSANKDRSQSRGKRLLDTIRGKKEGDAVKSEETKAEDAVVPPTETIAGPATTAAVDTTEPAVAPIAIGEEKETRPADLKDTKARRSSKFFDRFKGAVSPTTEKKEHDVVPTSETAATDAPSDVAPVLPLTETSKVEEPVVPEAAPVTESAVTDAKADETAAPVVPAKDEKRRSSFFGLGGLRKPSEKKIVKDETKPTEEAIKSEEVAKESEAAKPEQAAVPVEDEVATPAAPAVATADAKDTKTTPAKTEKKENAFAGIKRSLSKALHGGEKPKKEKSKPTEKVEEIKEETVSEKPAAPTTTDVKPTEPAVIGDVVPEAITVGTPTAPPASATVQATA